MPSAGLSLVGFIDDPALALQHLRQGCVPAVDTDVALTTIWNEAKAKLGGAVANAGTPAVQDIPQAQIAHTQQVINAAWWAPFFAMPEMQGYTFKLVEIAPLLAYQFSIDLPHAGDRCANLTQNPPLAELMDLCLPLNPVNEGIQTFDAPPRAPGVEPQGILLKSRSLNVVRIAAGMFNAAFLGLHFSVAWPFVHVVRHNGRCYLHNGFHRAYGIAKAGGTHVPCIFRDNVPTPAAAGIQGYPATFPISLLESQNAPTLRHFIEGRALDVMIRSVSRVFHVSWAEYVIPNE